MACGRGKLAVAFRAAAFPTIRRRRFPIPYSIRIRGKQIIFFESKGLGGELRTFQEP
jgi:hypothetical protein